MSSVILGIVGVIFFLGLAIAGASYFGSSLTATKVDAQATEYLNQSSQIARAIEQYSSENGKLPINGSVEPIDILVASKYMKVAPPGGRSPWVMNVAAKALLTPAADNNADGLKICIAARKRASMVNPTQVKKCDGSTGALSKYDPCCLM